MARNDEDLSILYLMLSKFHPEVGHTKQIDIANIPDKFPDGWKQYLSAFRVPYQEYILAQLTQRCEYMRLVYHLVQDFDIRSVVTKNVEPSVWEDDKSVEANYNAIRVEFKEEFGRFQIGSFCLATEVRPSPEERLEWGNMALLVVTNVRPTRRRSVYCYEALAWNAREKGLEGDCFIANVDYIAPAARVMNSLNIDESTQEVNKPLQDIILLGAPPPQTKPSNPIEEAASAQGLEKALRALYDGFNPRQRAIVHRVMFSCAKGPSVSLVDGPPGTGKTMMLASLVLVLAMSNPDKKILVTAPSTSALQSITQELIKRLTQLLLDVPMFKANLDHYNVTYFCTNHDYENLADEIQPYTDRQRELALTDKLYKLCKDTEESLRDAEAFVKTKDLTETDKRKCRVECLKKVIGEWKIYADSNLQESFALLEDVYDVHVMRHVRDLYEMKVDHLNASQGGDNLYRAMSEKSRYIHAHITEINSEAATNSRSRSFAKSIIDRHTRVHVAVATHAMKQDVASREYELIVIDEAAQLLEAQTVGLVTKSVKHIVLCGDPKQLKTYVVSDDLVRAKLDRSLFERLVYALKYETATLDTQYRMHPLVSKFVNKRFYGGCMVDSEIFKQAKTTTTQHTASWHEEEGFGPLVYYAHQNSEREEDYKGNTYNLEEAKAIMWRVYRFLRRYPYVQSHADTKRSPDAAGYGSVVLSTRAPSVGIVCLFENQKQVMLRMVDSMLGVYKKQVTVGTALDFQGQERDVILVSLTATGNATKLLRQHDTMNTIITRAVHSLWVFGDERLMYQHVGDNLLFKEQAQEYALEPSVWGELAGFCKQEGAAKYIAKGIETLTERALKANKTEEPFLKTLTNYDPANHVVAMPLSWVEGSVGELKKAILERNEGDVWSIWAEPNLFPALKAAKETRISLLRVIGELKRGYIKKHSLRRYLYSRELSDQVIRTTEIAGYCLVWHIEVNYSREPNMQIIKLDDIIPKGEFAHSRERYAKRINANKAYYMIANELKVPDEDQSDIIFPKHNISGLTKDVFKSQAEPARQYEVTDDVLDSLEYDKTNEEDMLEYLPYMLDETQKIAAVAKGSTVLVGRSGTGKTTVFASRLFSTYAEYVKLGTVPPPAMFTSQSGALVEQVRTEFQNRVKAFPLLPPQDDLSKTSTHSFLSGQSDGVLFLSAFELFYKLDDVLPEVEGEKKLFHRIDRQKKSDALGSLQLLGKEVQSAPKVVEEEIYDQESLVDFDRFERVYYKLAADTLRKAFSPAFVFAEIMTVIKGRAGRLDEDRTDWVLTRDEYINLQQESDSTIRFSKDRRITLYAFFQKYEKERLAKKHIDVPSIVQNLIQRSLQTPLPTLKGLYVDEVQDLLPCQWQLFKRLKNQNTDFMCGGDQAQSITAGNRFRFNELKKFIYDTTESRDGKRGPDAFELKRNYRTLDPVLQFANKVLAMLRHFFPNDIDSLPEERGKDSDDINKRPRLLTDDVQTSLDYLFYGEDHLGADQVILVRDEHEKKKLKAKLARNVDSEGKPKPLSATVFTILESKGLEYKDVVLYNVFKANPLGKSIRVLYNYNTKAAGKLRFTNFDAVKHFALCQMLKELYVGITRAKEKVVCVDDRDACVENEPKIYADVFQEVLVAAESRNEVEFTRNSTKEEWADRAKKLQDMGKFEEAAIAYARGSHIEKAAEMNALLARRAYKDEGDKSKLIEAAEFYEEAGMAAQGADLLRDNKLYDEAAAMYEQLEGKGKETVDCYWQSQQPLKVYKALEKHQNAYEQVEELDDLYIQLAPVLLEKNEPDLALKCTEHVSKSDTNSDRVCAMLEASVTSEKAFTRANAKESRSKKGKGTKNQKTTDIGSLVVSKYTSTPMMSTLVGTYCERQRVDRGVAFLAQHSQFWGLNHLMTTAKYGHFANLVWDSDVGKLGSQQQRQELRVLGYAQQQILVHFAGTALRSEIQKKLKPMKSVEAYTGPISEIIDGITALIDDILPSHGSAVKLCTDKFCKDRDTSYRNVLQLTEINSDALRHVLASLFVYLLVTKYLNLATNKNQSKFSLETYILRAKAMVAEKRLVLTPVGLKPTQPNLSRFAVFHKASVALLLSKATANNELARYAAQILSIYPKGEQRSLDLLLKGKMYVDFVRAVASAMNMSAVQKRDQYLAVLKAFFYKKNDWWMSVEKNVFLQAFPFECAAFVATFLETMATDTAKKQQLSHIKSTLKDYYDSKKMQDRGVKFFIRYKAYKTCNDWLTSVTLIKRCNSEPSMLDALALSQSRLGERLAKKHDNVKPNPKIKTLWKYIERMCSLRMGVLEYTLPEYAPYRNYVLSAWLNDTQFEWNGRQFLDPTKSPLPVNIRSVVFKETLKLVCVYAVLASVEPIKTHHPERSRTGPVLNKIVQKTKALQDIHKFTIPKLEVRSPVHKRVKAALELLKSNNYNQADELSRLLIK